MKPRLYLETTIPSYLVARPNRDMRLAADQNTTQEWWERRRHDFELYVSRIVILEARCGDATLAAARLERLHGIPILEPATASEQLVERLLADRIIPVVAADDARHLGYAAANGMDYLLTWNCRHLNNKFLQRRIERACEACGLVCPIICTPMELMNPE